MAAFLFNDSLSNQPLIEVLDELSNSIISNGRNQFHMSQNTGLERFKYFKKRLGSDMNSSNK